MTRSEALQTISFASLAQISSKPKTLALDGAPLSTPGAPGVTMYRLDGNTLRNFQDAQSSPVDKSIFVDDSDATKTPAITAEPMYFHRAEAFKGRGKQGATLNIRFDQTLPSLSADKRLSWGTVFTLVKSDNDDIPSVSLSSSDNKIALRQILAPGGVLSISTGFVAKIDQNATKRTLSNDLNKILGVTQNGTVLTSLFAIPATQIQVAQQFAGFIINLIGSFGGDSRDEVFWDGNSALDLAVTYSTATGNPNSVQIPQLQTNWILVSTDDSPAFEKVISSSSVRLRTGILQSLDPKSKTWGTEAFEPFSYVSLNTKVSMV